METNAPRGSWRPAPEDGIDSRFATGLPQGSAEGGRYIVLRRFAEYHDPQGAFGRRALIERAKGILMERHGISEEMAFEMLRESSREGNRKLGDLAAAVVDGHRLLPRRPQDSQPS